MESQLLTLSVELLTSTAKKKGELATCPICGGTFRRSRASNVTCSKRCSWYHWYNKNRESEKRRSYKDFLLRRIVLKKFCENCGKEYKTGYKRQRVCSRACYWKVQYSDNPLKYINKVKIQRKNNLEVYKKRDRDSWQRMRAERGMENAKMAKSRYPWLPLFTGRRHFSLKHGIPFDLTKEWCEEHWTGYCELTGMKFSLNAPKRGVFSPSIDKIVPKLGYVKSNCRFVLFGINIFKYNDTDETMYRIAEELLKKRRIISVAAIPVNGVSRL